jgi:hypothetical protein
MNTLLEHQPGRFYQYILLSHQEQYQLFDPRLRNEDPRGLAGLGHVTVKHEVFG